MIPQPRSHVVLPNNLLVIYKQWPCSGWKIFEQPRDEHHLAQCIRTHPHPPFSQAHTRLHTHPQPTNQPTQQQDHSHLAPAHQKLRKTVKMCVIYRWFFSCGHTVRRFVRCERREPCSLPRNIDRRMAEWCPECLREEERKWERRLRRRLNR